LKELRDFPAGKYKDQVDAAALPYLTGVGQVAKQAPALVSGMGNARNKVDTTLAPATVGRRTKLARQIFRFAQNRKWLEDNPFLALKIPSDENEDRLVYVPPSVVDEIIDFQNALGDTLESASDQQAGNGTPFGTPSKGVRGTSGAVKRKP